MWGLVGGRDAAVYGARWWIRNEVDVKPGVGLFGFAGVVAAMCAALDFCWSNPSFPHDADPDEAFSQGEYFKYSRYLVAFFCAGFVSLCGATVVYAQLGRPNTKIVAEYTMLVGFLALAFGVLSDMLDYSAVYWGAQWKGPGWGVALVGLGVSLKAAGSGFIKVTSTKNSKVNVTSLVIPGLGLLLVLLGALLFCASLFFYAYEPPVSMFGSLGVFSSQVEWEFPHGGMTLEHGVTVEWGEGVGIVISHMDSIVYQSPHNDGAFIVASLANEDDSTVPTATNDGEAGTFVIQDNPGTLSTEQVVRNVERVNSTAVQFEGNLYYVPMVGTSDARKSHFALVVNIEHSDNDTVVIRMNIHRDVTKGLPTNRVYLVAASDESERIFGLGESFSYMDLKGAVVPIITREQGVGRGLQPGTFWSDVFLGPARSSAGTATQHTYTAIPHFTTSSLRSFFLFGTPFSVMDFWRFDRISIEINATDDAVTSVGIIRATSPRKLVHAYTAHNDLIMRPLPGWVYNGAIMGFQGGRKAVAQKLSTVLQAGVPVSAIWLQDWAGQRNTSFGQRLNWDWQLDTKLYPDWVQWTRELWTKHNIYVLAYINPHMRPEGKLFNETKNIGCLIKRRGSILIQSSATRDFTFGTIDLFNETCVRYYASVIQKNMLANGIMGWMADFGEAIPFDADVPVDGHNAFPALWARTNRLAIDTFSNHTRKNAVFFTRSAGRLSPKYTTLQWMGDQLTSWDRYDGLQSALIGQLSAGLSGLTQTHSDVGGYTMLNKLIVHYVRDTELLLRWIEYSAFADSVFRTHEGLLPKQATQAWDPAILPHLKRFATIHRKISVNVRQRVDPGIPAMQSIWFNYPGNTETTSLTTQFMLAGPDIVVCPVMQPGVNHTDCYLPANLTYFHLFANVTYHLQRPGYVRCTSPIGSPCVLVTAKRKNILS
uniref:Alpha-glucosidase n=1 Tax=Mucochytrium quahogii TaxID=96639 RepID=A0A7S2RNS3_9STRA|mmetsp:Transcript_17330/g.37860  ORF Transcript_17330/g.37860 Transcript_17330/m.37860 type:complete len:936 (+) Transcript_17330:517-3324(+)